MFEGLIGAIIGGLLAIGGGWAQAAYYRSKRIEALKAALAHEIATISSLARINQYAALLRAQADLIVGGDEDALKRPFMVMATHNYFAVFDANAGDLGELETSLAGKVIAIYQAAKSWLDSLSPASVGEIQRYGPVELAGYYRLLAERADRICDLADDTVAGLSSEVVRHQIEENARRLTREA